MSDPIHISTAKPADIESLTLLVNGAYRGEGSKKGWTTEADLLGGIRTSSDALEGMMAKPGANILVARDEFNSLLGCLYLQKEEDHAYLGMLTVAPDLQAKGIGSRLLKAAETFAIEMNCNYIEMKVIDVRHELIAWYHRKGYYTTGVIVPFPNDPSFGIPKQPLQFAVLKKKL
jgi:ribosomal protein S18 acetylase RimI-like enzyme